MASKTTPKNNLRVVAKPQEDTLADYRLALISRQASIIGRREVLTGKAKFGIFGDGKEISQLAMAKAFRPGDWRSGYYRDQTFMFAIGASDVKKFFAQLYADSDLQHEPASGGRQMNSHFATRYIDADGQWLNQTELYNSAADISPTGGQMARLLGLAYASKLYRQNPALHKWDEFSHKGNEVAFGTIGNASTSEGIFWETLNAAGVLQVPMAISIWDDGYGISVPNSYQTTKGSISEVIKGFQHHEKSPGIDIYVVKGWDYQALCETYRKGIDKCRREHVPCVFHVIEIAQPQGHSTSGSHERYKDAERLKFEEQFDCLSRMRGWMIQEGIANAEALDALEQQTKIEVEALRQAAWDEYLAPIEKDRAQLLALFSNLQSELGTSTAAEIVATTAREVQRLPVLNRRSIHAAARRVLLHLRSENSGTAKSTLRDFVFHMQQENQARYSSHLLSESTRSPLRVQEIAAEYGDKPQRVDGRQVIQKLFDNLLAKNPRLFVIGEDVGKLGGVNAEFEGMNEKYGELRVTDTGIREATILGQGIGAAMRGLRPVVEIQYLDYLLYAFQTMSDDLASLHYRTVGQQIAPVIVLTRGHRLEGIWHTGSPMGMIINGIRGVHVCVPRNMVQAAGFYNTLLEGDDPGLVIEVLNGYRVKEDLPVNLTDIRVPLGVPEIIQSGNDITLVTYGACVRLAEEACKLLAEIGISVEIIDARCLLPFDRFNMIAASVEKTNALLCLDEDVPGGASAYMLQDIIERQRAYEFLDAPPRTLSAKAHRGAYASDGDYYSKPNVEDIFEMIYEMMRERFPDRFPAL